MHTINFVQYSADYESDKYLSMALHTCMLQGVNPFLCRNNLYSKAVGMG